MASTARPRHKKGDAGAFSGRSRPCRNGVGLAQRPAGKGTWESGSGSEPSYPPRPSCLRAASVQPAPSPLKRGVARNRVAAAIVVVLGDRDRDRDLGTRSPRVQGRTGTWDCRSLPAEMRVGTASLGASSRQFLWPRPLISGHGAEEEVSGVSRGMMGNFHSSA